MGGYPHAKPLEISKGCRAILLRVTNPAGTLVPREARTFGSYELVAKLATGGMAEIFLARGTDAAARGQLVVIKRILPHLADDEHFVTMFRDEAALASKLEHPHVCKVYTLGHQQGTWFIVMEYLHGVALSRLLSKLSRAKQLLDLRVVATIVIQACEGLHHAHELTEHGALLNVVHRDVSPPNIFLGADGVVKLLDFGIAKARGASSKTRTGTVKGKNAYMSPEQILGKTLDRRSDVFALGAVMYELIAIKRLFHRESDFLTFKAITEEAIPDVRVRRPDLPPAWREVVGRALARDVNARYATSLEMAEAVRAAVAPMGGPASQEEVSRLILADFAEELDAKAELCAQAPSGDIDADSATLPTLSGSSGQHVAAVGPTLADRPAAKRGNQLPEAGGELNTPPPRPSPKVRDTQRIAFGDADPPLNQPNAIAVTPAVGVVMPAQAQPVMMTTAPFPGTAGGTGELTIGGPTDIHTDLLGASRRGIAVRAIAALVLIGAAATGIYFLSGKDPKAVVVPPDATPAVVKQPKVDTDETDAGPNKDDIVALSKVGFFSIDADKPTEIFVDGTARGFTPITRIALSPGPHKVKAVGPRKKTKKFEITIYGGQDTRWGKIVW